MWTRCHGKLARMTDVPRFVVLGGPIPAALREALAGAIEFVTAAALSEGPADGVLLHCDGDVRPALRRFRESGGGLPIFGWSDAPVDLEARLAWIREGGDDVLSIDGAVDALLRRARLGTGRAVQRAEAAVRMDRWLHQMERYLAVRAPLEHGLGEAGRARILDLAWQRDQVARAAENEPGPDAFGQRRARDGWRIDWPARFEAHGEDVTLLSLGPDGFAYAAGRPPAPDERQRMWVHGATAHAVLDVEVRWQRRVTRERWEAGAHVLSCRCDTGTAPGAPKEGR